MRYGIPNFKLNKAVIDRRIDVLMQEGITFKYNQNIDVSKLPEGFDAYVIATGTPTARDLAIPGRELKGVYLRSTCLHSRIVCSPDANILKTNW